MPMPVSVTETAYPVSVPPRWSEMRPRAVNFRAFESRLSTMRSNMSTST